MTDAEYDVAIVGGGIVGLSTAMELSGRYAGLGVVVLEKEAAIASHQTGHNSGVIHSGLYYRPGSAKAELAVQGADQIVAFCVEHELPYERCGKVVVASRASQVAGLEALERRGRENGVPGLRMMGREELQELEPYAAGVRALHVPSTGIVDYGLVAAKYREILEGRGGEVRTATAVEGLSVGVDGVEVRAGAEWLRARYVINCGGLRADQVQALTGERPSVRIVPFRGEYYELVAGRRGLVRNLIYPVPDPTLPFLGPHLTRRIDGSVEAGPNAVLALSREGYRWRDIDLRDTWETVRYRGFQRLALRHWRTALREVQRSVSKGAFVRSLQELLPGVEADDLVRAGSGVRAQALDEAGSLIDDFRIEEGERTIHVLNAPSPGATSSLTISSYIVGLAKKSFELTA